MSMRYIDLKVGMDVEYWTRPAKKDISEPATGTGKIIYAGPHFITVQIPSGRKITITRDDILAKLARVQEKVSRSPSMFRG